MQYRAQVRSRLGTRKLLRFLVAPCLIFDYALLQAALADDDTMGNADQFHVGEHDARALVPVVEQHFNASGRQVLVQSIGSFTHRGALAVADRDERHLEWRDRIWKDDTALIMILFDRRTDDARNTHSITAHLESARSAGLVQESRFHGF